MADSGRFSGIGGLAAESRGAERRSKRLFRVFRHDKTLQFDPTTELWKEKL